MPSHQRLCLYLFLIRSCHSLRIASPLQYNDNTFWGYRSTQMSSNSLMSPGQLINIQSKLQIKRREVIVLRWVRLILKAKLNKGSGIPVNSQATGDQYPNTSPKFPSFMSRFPNVTVSIHGPHLKPGVHSHHLPLYVPTNYFHSVCQCYGMACLCQIKKNKAKSYVFQTIKENSSLTTILKDRNAILKRK